MLAPALAPEDGVLEAPAAAPPVLEPLVDGLVVEELLVDGVVLEAPLPVAELPEAPVLGVAELAPLPDGLEDDPLVWPYVVPASASSAAAVALVISFNVMERVSFKIDDGGLPIPSCNTHA